MENTQIKKKIILPLIFFLLGILVFFKMFEPVFEKMKEGLIPHSNIDYLTSSFEKSVKGFLVLSTIKSGVAVLEGSEIGVGFNLQIGDIVQSVYDYIDIAWKTALAGSTVLLITRMVYETILTIDHYFLGLFFFSISFFYISISFFKTNVSILTLSKELVLWSAVVNVVLYIVLPFSIAGAAFLSKKISRPLVNEAMDGFNSIQKIVSPDNFQSFMKDGDKDATGIMDKLNSIRKYDLIPQKIVEIYTILKQKVDDIAHWTIKLVSGYLFDCIIFPFALFIILFVFTKAIIKYIIGIKRDRSIRDDLRLLFEKYYGQSAEN
jgi:hypothetical protein